MIQKIKNLIDAWKLRRFLKKHGCKTIEQYNRQHDPLINRRANTVTYFYHGYPYVMRIPNSYYINDDIWYNSNYVLEQWCEQNCKDKWRNDWHRVHCIYSIDGNKGILLGVTDEINDIGGGDFMYFAFTSKKDYNWFILSHSFGYDL